MISVIQIQHNHLFTSHCAAKTRGDKDADDFRKWDKAYVCAVAHDVGELVRNEGLKHNASRKEPVKRVNVSAFQF